MSPPEPFVYPQQQHARRHGPCYANYEQCRDWLRDEFSFRCVYCLQRERWHVLCASFHIDHFIPQKLSAGGGNAYDNLLYLCASCNINKAGKASIDPCVVALGNCVQVERDGTISPLSDDGAFLIKSLRLDHVQYTEYRKLIISAVDHFKETSPALFFEWMRYPTELPDLARLAPPHNTRPQGVHESCFARKQRGALPDVY